MNFKHLSNKKEFLSSLLFHHSSDGLFFFTFWINILDFWNCCYTSILDFSCKWHCSMFHTAVLSHTTDFDFCTIWCRIFLLAPWLRIALVLKLMYYLKWWHVGVKDKDYLEFTFKSLFQLHTSFRNECDAYFCVWFCVFFTTVITFPQWVNFNQITYTFNFFINCFAIFLSSLFPYGSCTNY